MRENDLQRKKLIALGNQAYLRNCAKLNKKLEDTNEIGAIERFLSNNKVKCIKLNNTLDTGQIIHSYDGYI